ncbi:MAG: protease complex subunit PrcB family protein [Rubrobacteraceae bacterium]
MEIERLTTGTDGLRRPQVVVASSAGALSEATGVSVPDSGEGTYLAAFWGEQPTGGYTVEILSARTEEDRIVVRLALGRPSPDAMVSQALTYPYAVAALREEVPEDRDFVLVTKAGGVLDWPVRRL